MKAVNYTIPILRASSFVIEEEYLERFYPHLHRHRQVQICWIKKGKGDMVSEASIFPFCSNDTFIIASNVAHIFMNEKDENVNTISLFLEIDPDHNPLMSLPEMQETAEFLKRIPPCSRLNSQVNSLLQELLDSKEPYSLSVLIKILNFAKENIQIGHTTYALATEKSGDVMQSILKYTIENFSNDLKIKDVASVIGYTPEAFCRFFKKRTSKTFISYLNEIRISEACQKILNNENSSISSIAYACGFNNVSHFNRVFHKLKACSPLKYRKRHSTVKEGTAT